MATQTTVAGWYVKGFVRSHAEFAAHPQTCLYSPILRGIYEEKAEAERVRDHFLYGPYDCQGVALVHHDDSGRDDTLRALLSSHEER